MQILDAAATRDALPFERLIPALRAMFAAGCTVPPRHVHEVAAPGGGRFTSLIMPAGLEGRYDGTKTLERTIFESVGTALEDLAAAMLVFEGLSAGR